MSTARVDAKGRADGFTIAEALVAMFVFALAGVALIQMQSQSTRTFSRVETRALARIVAENALVDEMARSEAPVIGAREGEAELGERSWRWTVAIAPTTDARTVRVEAQAFAAGSEAPSANIVAFKVVEAVR
jgi:general secretion pathway protein I